MKKTTPESFFLLLGLFHDTQGLRFRAIQIIFHLSEVKEVNYLPCTGIAYDCVKRVAELFSPKL